MARPAKRTVDYFPHSCVHHSRALFVLEERWANDGYAFWFKLLEELGSREDHYLDLNDEATGEFLCSKTHCTPDKVQEILTALARMEAIDRELWSQKLVWCQHFVDGISDVYARYRHGKPPERPSLPTGKPIASPITTQNNDKVKESKVKESKVKSITPEKKVFGEFQNVLLTEEELGKLAQRFPLDFKDKVEILSEALASRKGYKEKYTDHYATILSWARRDAKEGNNGRTNVNRGNTRKPGQLPDYYPSVEEHWAAVDAKREAAEREAAAKRGPGMG